MIFDLLIKVFLLIFSSIGLIGNILLLLICTNKNLRNTPTFLVMGCSAMINMITLFSIILYPFFIDELNLECFKFIIIITISCYQSAIYLQILIMFDQFMCLKNVMWRKSYFDLKKSITVSPLIILSSFLFNIVLSFTANTSLILSSNYSSNNTDHSFTNDFISSSVIWFKVGCFV